MAKITAKKLLADHPEIHFKNGGAVNNTKARKKEE